MNITPNFGSTYHVASPNNTHSPKNLLDKLSQIKGFSQINISKSFQRSLHNKRIAFSVPNKFDPQVTSILEEDGYRYELESSFVEGSGCLTGYWVQALFYEA